MTKLTSFSHQNSHYYHNNAMSGKRLERLKSADKETATAMGIFDRFKD